MVGAYYWLLAPGRNLSIDGLMYRVAAPASVVLPYVQPWFHNMSSRQRVVRTEREFRFPAPDDARARAMVGYFNRILAAGESPSFRRRLARVSNWALAAGACSLLLLVAGLGFALNDRDKGVHRPERERAVLVGIITLGAMGSPLLLLGAALRSRD